MKYLKYLLVILVCTPVSALAHETRMYEINGVPYEMVIGSLDEPVVVDDETGVSLEVVRNGEYFTDGAKLLKVELISGEHRRVQDFKPVYGSEGSYRSPYTITDASPIRYRVFGTLEGIAFDVTFACNPVGHEHTQTQAERKVIGEGVIETSMQGMFSCPESKKELGFPHEGVSLKELQEGTHDAPVQKDGGSALALLIGLCALFFTAVVGYRLEYVRS